MDRSFSHEALNDKSINNIGNGLINEGGKKREQKAEEKAMIQERR